MVTSVTPRSRNTDGPILDVTTVAAVKVVDVRDSMDALSGNRSERALA